MFQCHGEDIMHAGPFARMLCYCAKQLAEVPSPADAPIWTVRCPSAYNVSTVSFKLPLASWTVQRLVSVMFPCYTR